MKKAFSILLLSLFVFSFIACDEQVRREPRSVGATSEILVVSQNTAQWEGRQGEAIRAYFAQPQYGLPQQEPLYKLAHITVDGLSDMFRKHRNILIIENNPRLETALVETRSNLWAKPQRVIKIVAADADQWVEAFRQHQEGFKVLIDRTERERLMNIFRPTTKADVVEELYNHMGFTMMVPEGFFVAKKEDGFIWIRKEMVDLSQALIAYSIPYRDTFDLNPSRLIAVRDSILRKHIPGPTQGSFMATDTDFIPPRFNRTDQFVTDFAVETRGLWRVVGDFMGGPFLSYTIVDAKNGRLLTLEGYVYAPHKDKRDYLRQLEAILYSFAWQAKAVADAPEELD